MAVAASSLGAKLLLGTSVLQAGASWPHSMKAGCFSSLCGNGPYQRDVGSLRHCRPFRSQQSGSSQVENLSYCTELLECCSGEV